MPTAVKPGFILRLFPKQLSPSPPRRPPHADTDSAVPGDLQLPGKLKGERFGAVLQVLGCLKEGWPNDEGVDLDFRRSRFSFVLP